MNWLPNDDARCNGYGSDEDGWRKGCEICVRRTAPRPGVYSLIPPPATVAFQCPRLIEPEEETT
jgi:hypothetical protein